MFEKICGENQNMFSIAFPKIVRSACRTTKATGTHSEYVIIMVPPLQQWIC